jgi:DNA-binding NarL/FixJ family response regulator
MQHQAPFRLLIIEWHPILTAEVRTLLGRDPGLNLVGHVTTAVEAARFVRSQRVDLALIETTLPDPGAVETARFFRMRMPETVIGFFTRASSQEELFEAARVGVAAYLRASTDERVFVNSLLRAARGEFPIDEEVVRYPAVAARILSQFRRGEQPGAPSTLDAASPLAPASPVSERLAPLFVPLSNREIEILDLVARGNSNKLVARRLGISDQTVKNHISAILRKLEVNDRTEAVVYALRNGWIRIDKPASTT